jgi:hypothetical protein
MFAVDACFYSLGLGGQGFLEHLADQDSNI